MQTKPQALNQSVWQALFIVGQNLLGKVKPMSSCGLLKALNDNLTNWFINTEPYTDLPT